MALRVSRELLPDLMRQLGKDNPTTISFYYAADNVVRGDAPMVEFWVDAWPDFSVVVKAVDPHNPEFPYYEACWSIWARDKVKAREMLASPPVLDWTQSFRSRVLTKEALEALQEVAAQRGQLVVRAKALYVFQGDQTTLPDCSVPGNFTLSSLKPDMSESLSSRYGLGDIPSEHSAPWIRACVQRFPSSCVFHKDGETASYAFLNFNGGLACVETLAQHRQQGLGRTVVVDLCRKVLQRGQRPFVFVPEDHEVGRRLYQSAGMEAVATCYRCRFVPNSQ